MKKRIYGLETEYAVIIAPEHNSTFTPTRLNVFNILREVVASHYKVLHSKELKQGVFMQNGGRFHHEACLNALLEGVIEFSTPECTNSRDLAIYSKACDEILEEVREELQEKLQYKGFRGNIFFGKNCTDKKGNFYGTHENYLVCDPIIDYRRFILYTGVTIFFSIFIIVVIIFNLPVLACILVLSLMLLLLGILHLPLRLLGYTSHTIIEIGNGIIELIKIMTSLKPTLFTRIFGELFRCSTILWAYSYGFFLRQLVFKKMTKFLTPYLLTRIIFSGSGRCLDSLPPGEMSKGIPFELSQKAETIKTVCTIFWDDYYKPVFSLKNFIKNPRSIFKSEKRLHIMYCDSNMNEFVTYINTGITGLLIRMIEEDHSFLDLNPKNPISALREFSRDLTMRKQIPLKNGTSMSSLEITKIYLGEAKKFYSSPEKVCEHTDNLLHIWENILNCLEINPHLMYKELDWVAKKDLLNEVIKDREIFFSCNILKWFKVLQGKFQQEWIFMSEETLKKEIERNLSIWNRKKFFAFLKKEDLTCQDFLEKFQIFYQLQKIDLKYHELNKNEGYYYRLAKAGLITMLSSEEDVTKAKLYPPHDTRANIRGFLVKTLAENSLNAVIGWDDVIISDYAKHIYFLEPFEKELPENDRNYINSLVKMEE